MEMDVIKQMIHGKQDHQTALEIAEAIVEKRTEGFTKAQIARELDSSASTVTRYIWKWAEYRAPVIREKLKLIKEMEELIYITKQELEQEYADLGVNLRRIPAWQK